MPIGVVVLCGGAFHRLLRAVDRRVGLGALPLCFSGCYERVAYQGVRNSCPLIVVTAGQLHVTSATPEPDRGTREGLAGLGSGAARELHVMHSAASFGQTHHGAAFNHAVFAFPIFCLLG